MLVSWFCNLVKPFALILRPGKLVRGNAKTLVLQKYWEWRDRFEIMVALVKDEQISLLFLLSPLSEDRATQTKSSKKSKISKFLET